MSNDVGALYRSVIEGVIAAARLDLEDSGEDLGVLDLLKNEWRNRLSAMQISNSGQQWDDEETLRSAAAGVPGRTTASLGGGGMQSLDPGFYNPAPSSSQVKVESGMPNLFAKEDGAVSMGSGMSDPTNYQSDPAAAMRAAQHVQQYAQGDPSLAAGMPQAVRDLMSRAQPQNQSQQPPSDGQRQPGMGSLPPHLRQQLEATMNYGVPQTDGPADEEVGSDLDDSEDDELNSENEDEEDQSQMMLCLYDKVQRVKNKWKYTLKDGIANVNGLDYVFARANGESEW